MSAGRICIVTAGHLSTCPRMLKAADALHEAGHDVRVISTRQTRWATETDALVRAARGWRWTVVDYDRTTAAAIWLRTGVRQRVSRSVAAALGPRAPDAVTVAAFSRTHRELVDAILAEGNDFIYGGTTGAIAAVAEAARRSGVPYAVDFEDFHCAEHDEATIGGRLHNMLALPIMQRAASGAAFVTAGSAAIADACRSRLGIRAFAVNNVFPLPRVEPTFEDDGGPLRLYWFSQTIGAGRGLEDVLSALGLADIDAQLFLRGSVAPEYRHSLTRHAVRSAPRTKVTFLDPAPPDSMVDACRSYHAGISAEQRSPLNRGLGLTNKTLTYPLAGLALALTDTPGNAPLIRELAGESIAFAHGDVHVLAERLEAWSRDRGALERARRAAWRAAQHRWHWEHADERGALLAAVASALS